MMIILQNVTLQWTQIRRILKILYLYRCTFQEKKTILKRNGPTEKNTCWLSASFFWLLLWPLLVLPSYLRKTVTVSNLFTHLQSNSISCFPFLHNCFSYCFFFSFAFFPPEFSIQKFTQLNIHQTYNFSVAELDSPLC